MKDAETRRLGDAGTRGRGDASEALGSSGSLCPRVSASPHPSSLILVLQGHNLARSDRIRYIAIDEDLLQ